MSSFTKASLYVYPFISRNGWFVVEWKEKDIRSKRKIARLACYIISSQKVEFVEPKSNLIIVKLWQSQQVFFAAQRCSKETSISLGSIIVVIVVILHRLTVLRDSSLFVVLSSSNSLLSHRQSSTSLTSILKESVSLGGVDCKEDSVVNVGESLGLHWQHITVGSRCVDQSE